MLAHIAAPVLRAETRTTPLVRLASGDEAVGWAALDAGIRFAASYPGTPASDVLEWLFEHADPALVRNVWSVNEKVAYESALAVAMAGQRSLVALKHVGLNVAADAFVSSCYSGVRAGFVVLVADDPGCHSSQNEQDSRHYRQLAHTLLLEPSDAQEAYAMTREAFRLSERFELPVMVRLTTRTAHGCRPVTAEAPEGPRGEAAWPKDPGRFLLVPTVSRALHRRLAGLQDALAQTVHESRFTEERRCVGPRGSRRGVLCSGVGFALAEEYAEDADGLLKIPGAPFPDRVLASFLSAHDEVLVLEEGDPWWEDRARALARGATEVRGRLSGHLSRTGELRPEEVQAALRGEPCLPSTLSAAPPRLPEICQGCGYHQVFGALADIPGLATPSDIGCNTLGGLPPYRVMDSNLAMGSSIGMACGLAAVGVKKIVAILGDSTFFHSGIPPLIEAVRQGLQLTVLILDNGTTAMTGGQDVPHTHSKDPRMGRVDLEACVRSLGVASCTVFDPHRLGRDGIRALVEEQLAAPRVNVLLYRSPCLLYSPGYGRSPATQGGRPA